MRRESLIDNDPFAHNLEALEACAHEGHLPDPAPGERTLEARSPTGFGLRRGNALYLDLRIHARQKKNAKVAKWVAGKYGPRRVIVPNELYGGFLLELKAAVLPMRVGLKLPLPKGRYLFSAEFHIPLGEQVADFDNLVTGTLDALKDADVFADDREFCGSRFVDVYRDVPNPLTRVWIVPHA